MDRLEKAITAILDGTELIVADIGAASGLPMHLRPLGRIATVLFFDPDESAAEAVRRQLVQDGYAKAQVLPVALAGSDGPRTLYVTNSPTGSSLLKPVNEYARIFGNPDYFYPMREITVQTRKLKGVLADFQLPRVDAMKIDVQGAELEVLQGLEDGLTNDTLCVELEIGFPGLYNDQPGFGALDKLLTDAGFYLFDLRLSSNDICYRGGAGCRQEIFRASRDSRSITKRISEADSVYFRRVDHVLAHRDSDIVRRLMAMMCAYGFFVDALDLADQAAGAGIFSAQQAASCRDAVVAWHHTAQDAVLESARFAGLIAFARRAWRSLQRRLLGRHFYRWMD